MATLSEARKCHGSHSAELNSADAVSAGCVITPGGVIRKLVGGGKHTGPVYDQMCELPTEKACKLKDSTPY